MTCMDPAGHDDVAFADPPGSGLTGSWEQQAQKQRGHATTVAQSGTEQVGLDNLDGHEAAHDETSCSLPSDNEVLFWPRTDKTHTRVSDR